jgi:transposase
MSPKRTYYGYTTSSQRKLLFETWEATRDISESCRKARVGERTFYYWKSRFEEFGYPGLEKFRSRAPKNHHHVDSVIEQQVITMHQANPEWGKKRIAQELAKGNNWVPVLSLNTVRRILSDAGLWPKSEEKKRGPANR